MFSDTSHSKSRHLPKCMCHKAETTDCLDLNEKVRANYRQLDIEDVTESVMKVMRICGLKPWEVKLAAGVIRRSFTHFEEVLHRIDRVPRKRFGKESFLHGLAHEAQMSRIDAQMAYAIVKRAFKAFYYGTGAEGRRYVCLQINRFHGEECMWLHAARRTAEIHAVLAGMMLSEQRLFEERIECVYKSLVDVLKTRVLWENDLVCTCGQSAETQVRAPWQLPLSQVDSAYSGEVEVLYHKENMGASSAPSKTSTRVPTAAQSRALSSASSRHNHGLKKANQTLSNKHTPVLAASAASSVDQPRCNCAKLRCFRDGGEARESPEITAECSQGPYICRWLPYEGEEEQFPEHRVPFPPMEDVCPPCPSDELPCDPECTCTCDVCTCRPAYDDGGDHEEEHLGEQLSKSGLEDHDTDFCWLAPFKGSSCERMARKREQEELLRADRGVVAEEEQEFQCRCTCDVKQQAYPHLFTYLMPFREKKPVPEEAQPALEPEMGENEGEEEREKTETESEDLLSKPPPWGISLATYRCWVKPPAPNSDSTESDPEPKPPLVVVLADKPKPEVQITVKKQHNPGQSAASAPAAAAPLPKAPVLPNKPAPIPAPSKPPLAPQKPEENAKEDKITREEVLDIIGLRFRPKK